MINEEELAGLMSQAENGLADGNLNEAAQALEELAQVFARLAAGLPREEELSVINSFHNVRKSIIFNAEKRTGAAFIRERLQIIEKDRTRDRAITNGYSGKGSAIN